MDKAIGIGLALLLGLLIALPAHALDVQKIGLEPDSVEKVNTAELDKMRGRYFGFYFAINFVGYWDTVGSVPSAMLTFKAGSKNANVQGVINLIEKGNNQNSNDEDQNEISGNTSSSPGNGSTQSNSASHSSTDSSNGGSAVSSSNAGSGNGSSPAVKASAVIGSGAGAGANGILQLTQVPGSKNFVYSGIIFNLLIVNVKDNGVDNLRNVLSTVLGGPL